MLDLDFFLDGGISGLAFCSASALWLLIACGGGAEAPTAAVSYLMQNSAELVVEMVGWWVEVAAKATRDLVRDAQAASGST